LVLAELVLQQAQALGLLLEQQMGLPVQHLVLLPSVVVVAVLAVQGGLVPMGDLVAVVDGQAQPAVLVVLEQQGKDLLVVLAVLLLIIPVAVAAVPPQLVPPVQVQQVEMVELDCNGQTEIFIAAVAAAACTTAVELLLTPVDLLEPVAAAAEA
jgi:hypothetical protein